MAYFINPCFISQIVADSKNARDRRAAKIWFADSDGILPTFAGISRVISEGEHFIIRANNRFIGVTRISRNTGKLRKNGKGLRKRVGADNKKSGNGDANRQRKTRTR